VIDEKAFPDGKGGFKFDRRIGYIRCPQGDVVFFGGDESNVPTANEKLVARKELTAVVIGMG
jgi:hypothetical protein